MSRRTVVIICIGLALLAVAALIPNLMRPRPEPPAAAVKTEKPAPPPVIREAPAAAPAPAPAPEPERRSARRAPDPKPAATPAPAPAPEPAEAAADTATLRLESDVPGAQVFIDRVFYGPAPVTVPNLKTGTHRLNVSAEGYDGIADTIDVSPGPRNILVKFKEVRLNATLGVVHKHRIGSCTGRLVATPQGLRYETTDKGDAFSAGLLDLETFQIDYLEKRLRVKTRKGKQYDFTDPEGNADRLFVFHRDVDKARERLKKGDPPAGE